MRLHSTDFPLEKRILVAKEDRIYYDGEKNGLADTWDMLLEYYNARLRDEHSEEMEESELYKMLCAVRAEAETGRAVYELIEKGVLKTHAVRPRYRSKCEFKPLILQSCLDLLGMGIIKLRNAVLFEERVWEKVRDVGYSVRLVRGEIRVHVDGANYLELNENCEYVYPAEWRPRGVTCRVRYLDVILECAVPPRETENEARAVGEYFLEKSMMQRVARGDLEIEIGEMSGEGQDPLCRCIVEELRNGCSMEEVCRMSVLYLSRVLVRRVAGDAECVFLSRGSALQDGLSSVFFVVAGEKVIRAVREADRLEIFVDEMPVRFSGTM